jgi:Zn-dependent protease with chaperone function
VEHILFPLIQFQFPFTLPKEGSSKINSIVQKVVRKSGLKHKVKVYVLNTKKVNANAFSVPGPSGFTAITVTQGLIDLRSEKEFECVIAHECAHIYYEDCSRGMFMGTLLSCFGTMLATTIASKDRREIKEYNEKEQRNIIEKMLYVFKKNKKSRVPFFLFPIATFTLLRELWYLLDKAVSRKMEYRADKFAAKVIGEGPTISMLKKFKPVHPIGIVVERITDFFELEGTHPTTDNRINAIRKASFSPLIRWG